MRRVRLDALPSELQTEIIGHLCAGHRSRACYSLSRCSRYWRAACVPFAFASIDLTEISNDAISRFIAIATTHSHLIKRLAISIDLPSRVLDRHVNQSRISNEFVAQREMGRQSLIATLLPTLSRLTDVTIYFHSYWSAYPGHREDGTRVALKALSALPSLHALCLKGKLSAEAVHLLYGIVPHQLLSVEVQQLAHFAQSCSDALWSTFLQIPTITSMTLHGISRPSSSEVIEALPRLVPRLANLSFQHQSLNVKDMFAILHAVGNTARYLEFTTNCPSGAYPLPSGIKHPTFPHLSTLDLRPGSSEMLAVLLDLFRHTAVIDVRLHLNDLFHSPNSFFVLGQEDFFPSMQTLTLRLMIHLQEDDDSDDGEAFGTEWDDYGQKDFNQVHSDGENSDQEDAGRRWEVRQGLRADIRRQAERQPDFDDPEYFEAWRGGNGWNSESLKRAATLCKVRKVWFTHFVVQVSGVSFR